MSKAKVKLTKDCPDGSEKGSLKKTLRVPSLCEVPKPLLAWYDANRRKLPWRENVSAYRVWVSEVMLQQTRVEAVKPYFERFMEKFPDIASLANAEEEVLLKYWEGLGYYSRARNLKKAAEMVEECFGGVMPADYEELLQLPGIGSYTAGAISSIAYGKPVPAVDGNVLRVLARLREDERLITDESTKRAVREELLKAIPRRRPGDFNQAMMEIGALVCIPNGAPLCEVCPLAVICLAHADGREMEFPKKAEKKQRNVEEKTILVLRDEENTVVQKRPERGLLAGMYEFPSMEGFQTPEQVLCFLSEHGVHAIWIKPLEDAKHIFTHKEWHMKGYMIRVDELGERETSSGTEGWILIDPNETREKYPIPSAFRAYTKYLQMKLGKERLED